MSNWNVLAELDPLWTVLSDPEKKFGKWDHAEFFGTGAREAERVLALCASNGCKVSYGKFLDFGCGVGRMTRAFSSFFKSCVGIDVSENMLSLARRFNSDRPHCEFIASGAGVLPFADKSFDFVFSVLVLQHLPTRNMILGYIAEFIRVAKNNGVIVFQLPNEVPLAANSTTKTALVVICVRRIPRSWLFKKLGLAPIRMNGISRREVEDFIRAQGARVQAVERYDPSEGRYHSYYYFVLT